jgi:diguanylate cyclase
MAKAKKFSYRVNFVAEDQTEVRATLQKLLQLVIENIGELVIDDKWLHGQIDVISQLLAQQPLNLRQLDNVESRLRDLIVKQSALKQNLTEAQGRLKSMLASFVDRLADFSESTADYQEKIEKCAERITQADTIGELSDVLDDVMRETRGIQINALRSHGELTAMRQRVEESEREISRLQNELAHASEMVRHDPLTGALNRKGMDEAVDREIARVRRHGGPMSVAMLDIDNFKMLNDRLGHDAGDAALVHLTKVVHDTIRPQDTLARYGGEEFVILLPNTGLDDGSNVMVRVQRELTRKFFFYNHEKVLITFSCGVAELMAEEPPEEAIKRADSAMYLAKRMGKNRVVAA